MVLQIKVKCDGGASYPLARVHWCTSFKIVLESFARSPIHRAWQSSVSQPFAIFNQRSHRASERIVAPAKSASREARNTRRWSLCPQTHAHTQTQKTQLAGLCDGPKPQPQRRWLACVFVHAKLSLLYAEFCIGGAVPCVCVRSECVLKVGAHERALVQYEPPLRQRSSAQPAGCACVRARSQ